MIKTYNELRRLETFKERFDYLSLKGVVGESTFGYNRWLNQYFYRSREWKQTRYHVIVRDQSCDLGIPGYDIYSDLLVHHMNPITMEDIEHGSDSLIDPEYLITMSLRTHNAIHYGDASLLPALPIERKAGDTSLWQRDIDSRRTSR